MCVCARPRLLHIFFFFLFYEFSISVSGRRRLSNKTHRISHKIAEQVDQCVTSEGGHFIADRILQF